MMRNAAHELAIFDSKLDEVTYLHIFHATCCRFTVRRLSLKLAWNTLAHLF